MDVMADEKVLIAMRDDPACQEALLWSVAEFKAQREAGANLCFLLTHVVTELRNTAGQVVKLSQADGPSVAVHICDRVLPYLEGLQDLCDDSQIQSTVHVVKNENKGEGILEAAEKLEATLIVLAAVPGKAEEEWHTISACLQEDRLPPGCTCTVIQDGQVIRNVSSVRARTLKAGAGHPAPVFHGTGYGKMAAVSNGEAGPEGGVAAEEEGGEEDGTMSALEMARQAYRQAAAKADGGPAPPPAYIAPEGDGGADAVAPSSAATAAPASASTPSPGAPAAGTVMPPKPKGKAAKQTVNAKVRLEKNLAEARDVPSKDSLAAEQNPLLSRSGLSLGLSESTASEAPRSDFQQYTLQQLQVAIDHFWPNHVCGEGSYGVVYKGLLDEQQVAIKQLKNPDAKAALDEIEREVEVQKRIDHSNLVRLLGYCIEDRSLVYEFMSNGSLEDRLLCVGGTPPLLWPERCRIAMEVAAGLQHLHTRKPPIVHRDVKPANILLDDKCTAKLGDVGLARLMGDLAPGHSHVVRKSVIVGTEHYVDPEYLCARRGYLGPKSDVYSFGIVLLQMLVGEVPNLRRIDAAVEKEELKQMLDPRAGEWPLTLAMDLANLGLWCSEMDRRDRPDLSEEVIPALMQVWAAAAAEIAAWEQKQEALRKEAEEREQAAKAEQEAKKKEAEEAAAAAAKAAEAQRALELQKAAEPKPAAPAATAKDQPACCTIL